MFDFTVKIAVVTGGARVLGKRIREQLEKVGFITDENLCIDGGTTRLMIDHGDNGRSLNQ